MIVDTQWLSTDRSLSVISPLCLPVLGTGINAAVIGQNMAVSIG